MSTCDRPAGADPALVRVVRGAPTPDELAALVGVLLVHRRRAHPPAATGSLWACSGNPAHQRTRPGADAWRHSGLPS